MGWSIGFDPSWHRDIGYGVPATCDHPKCGASIDRGLAYVCGGEPYGGDRGCGLFFCSSHLWVCEHPDDDDLSIQLCERCADDEESTFEPTPDVAVWVGHKLTDSSWQQWRTENLDEVAALRGDS